MAKLTTEEFIAAIKELSVLELNELVKACEEEYVSPTLEDQREMHFFFFIELKNLAAMLSIIIQRS